MMVFCIYCMSKHLKIYFIDVGQGDATFIVTPQNKTILIDGGGSSNQEFDVGKKILLPYLLDRGCTKLDYIFISHFDEDHVGGILTIIQELKVKNIILGKQFEKVSKYQEFLKIVKEKNINIYVVEEGQKINIEKNLHFDIIWPSLKNKINENSINNNSLVCKMVYQKFSILFTGDIEEVAERKILEKEEKKEYLKATILKVPHHGSKTSSIESFIQKVNPKIALVGVGANNTFGHPNQEVIERIESLRH